MCTLSWRCSGGLPGGPGVKEFNCGAGDGEDMGSTLLGSPLEESSGNPPVFLLENSWTEESGRYSS